MGKKVILSITLILLLISLTGVSEGKETFIDQTFRIEGEEHKEWVFDPDGDMTLLISCRSHYFSFSLYLLDEDNYQRFLSNDSFESVYQASTIYSANLTWDVPSGKHHLVAINNFDDIGVNIDMTIDIDDENDVACCSSILIGLLFLPLIVFMVLIYKRDSSPILGRIQFHNSTCLKDF